ncbi:MAG: DTW domain-containing protein [Deltaproteobacteria bacterium]|nr:DTW domain-containing protein [Deltaproteobacteria bacterium]
MHPDRCICHLIPSLDLKTKLSLVVHHREMKRTTSTGRLAVKALVNSELYIRGRKDVPLNLSAILDDQYETYILYPAEDAVDIESIKPNKPVQLIVSDGNWRQAGKLHRRHEELKHLPRVCIKIKNHAEQNLRREHFEEGYSTLEAIALAFGFLEGTAVRDQLLALYQHKLKATLEGRGTWQGD